MILRITSNDTEGLKNVLAGKAGWSDKDPERRFYLQNVIIGRVSDKPYIDKNKNKHYYLLPWEVKT